MSSPRRFPPPWSVEEQHTCFVVAHHNGQQLAYVYFEEEPEGRSAAKLLSKDYRVAKLVRNNLRSLKAGAAFFYAFPSAANSRNKRPAIQIALVPTSCAAFSP